MNYKHIYDYIIGRWFLAGRLMDKNKELEQEIDILKKEKEDLEKYIESSEKEELKDQIARFPSIKFMTDGMDIAASIGTRDINDIQEIFYLFLFLDKTDHLNLAAQIYDALQDKQSREIFAKLYKEYVKTLDEPIIKPGSLSSPKKEQSQNDNQF